MIHRKTKIVCTLGPATEDDAVLRELILSGMNVARLNFSHGTHETHLNNIRRIEAFRRELNLPIAIMLDTKGPEIRLETFENGKVQLKKGQTFTLVTQSVVGNAERASITYPDLPRDIHEGTTILIDDGLVGMTVRSLTASEIVCIVNNDGVISDRKSVNVPDVDLSMPYLSAKDREDITFGVKNGVDFVAASFTRTAEDILDVRKLFSALGRTNVSIIAKIENMQGVQNIDEILRVSDGIMVARGDLGVEIPLEKVPVIQKMLIHKAYSSGKQVITATQMLDSMMKNPRPTRAEAADVANAIYDGTGAIMLSGETAAGKYPAEAVKTMDAIARRTESGIDCSRTAVLPARTHLSVTAATAHAACTTAADIGADAILTVSQGGVTAQMVSRFRPEATVVALLLDPQIQRQMALYWGLVPIMMERADSTDELVRSAIDTAERAGLVKHGDLVVVTAGVPVGVSGTTNMIRIEQVGGALVNAAGIGDQTASGPLCVCRTPEEVPEKFHPGDVLVVPYTNNELLPYMKEAAAVISEELSPEGHTATVGLLLHKPVIIGAVHATRRLHDGVQVSVDCARGIVQVMPQ